MRCSGKRGSSSRGCMLRVAESRRLERQPRKGAEGCRTLLVEATRSAAQRVERRTRSPRDANRASAKVQELRVLGSADCSFFEGRATKSALGKTIQMNSNEGQPRLASHRNELRR
eukprot:3194237-Pleurochrysis_carterae.AAC.8